MSKRLSSRPVKLGLSLIVATLILSGCARTMGIVGINDLCNRENPDDGLIRPFYWSVNDTDETILQAKGRNTDYETVCK